MEDFLSRFSDSLIFEHPKTFFSNEESGDDNKLFFKNPIPKPNPNTKNPNEKPTFQRRFLFHIFRSIHSLTFSYIYPDYGTLCDNVINHRTSLKTQTRNLHTFLLQLPRNKGGNDRDRDHDLDLFIKQYREYYADIETKWECLETQIKILEKKLKLDIMLIDLKLMDGGKRDVMMLLLEGIKSDRRYFRRQMMVLLADKTAYEFRFLGLKGLISNDVGSFDFAYDARVLHRLIVENYTEHLRRKLSRDGIYRLNSATSSRLLFFHELSRPGK